MKDWLLTRERLQLDIGTSAYAQMLRVISRFHEAIYSDPESTTGLNQVTFSSLLITMVVY